MATALATMLAECTAIAKGVYRQKWSAGVVASGNVGNPMVAPNLPDKTVYIEGPSTAAGTTRIIIEGTNGAVVSTATWTTLTTPTDGALDFSGVTAARIKVIRENPRMIRPRFPVVTAGETVSVEIIAR